MTIVEVVFPKGGGLPIVTGGTEAVCEDQVIAWHIKSENPAVQQVKIEFNSGERFFPRRRRTGGPLPARFEETEAFDYGAPKVQLPVPGKEPQGTAPNPVVEDTQVIWGRAPVLVDDSSAGVPLDPGSSVTCKYTIYGLDSKGGPVAEVPPLDPNIIISKP